MTKSREQKQHRFDAEVRRWDASMKKGGMDKALVHAAKALQIAASKKDRALQKAASVYIGITLDKSIPTSKSNKKAAKIECSFCGRTRNQARLLLGADGNICEHCAEKASSFFADSK